MASVLFVDDEPHFLAREARALGERGFVVHYAETLKDALEKLETLEIDVLVLDIYFSVQSFLDVSSLPETEIRNRIRELVNQSANEPGLALYSRVRKEHPQIRPIIYSRVAALYLRNGPFAVDCPILRKPPGGDLEDLVNEVAKAAESAR